MKTASMPCATCTHWGALHAEDPVGNRRTCRVNGCPCEVFIGDRSVAEAPTPDPVGWYEYLALTREWLRQYPASVFTGRSGDPGAIFVVAVRRAFEQLGDTTTVLADKMPEWQDIGGSEG